MMIDGVCDADQLTRAIERLGGKVTWPADLTIVGARTVTLKVEVDNDEAFEALPESYFSSWGDDEVQDVADPGDVRDFVAACGRGDLMIAGALAPPLFSSDANIAAIERGLHERRAA